MASRLMGEESCPWLGAKVEAVRVEVRVEALMGWRAPVCDEKWEESGEGWRGEVGFWRRASGAVGLAKPGLGVVGQPQ